MEKGMHIQTIQPTNSAVSPAVHYKGANPMLSEALKMANEAMLREASVRYMDVAKSLHGDFEYLREVVDGNFEAPGGIRQAISDFVNRTITDFGLVRNRPGVDPDLVRGYNLAQVAICEFSRDSDEWKLGPDGRVTKVEDDGLVSMRPVRDLGSTNYGFGILFHEGAYRSENGAAMDMGEGVPVSGKYDIGEAVVEYDLQRSNRSSMSM